MKIAAAYIRVSTDDQVEYSPESQRKAILDYAKRNGYIVPEEYIFADEGISGRSTKRPSFQRMIGIAKQKPAPFEAILVWKFSRFARNREDSIVYKSMLRKQCGIDVISISEQLGEDKTSILIEALLEAMDEYYSINLSEEVVRGMSEKARRGGVLGGVAYGYRAEHGKVIPDPDTAPIVRKIFADFVAGVPIRKIANTLNDIGIRTKMGNLWDNRGIEYVVRNIAYIGKTHWTPGKTNGKHAEKITERTIIAEGTHEPIIDEETFRLAQERIAELKRTHIYKEHQQHGKMFMLKGLVRCDMCGSTLVRNNESGVQCHKYTTGKCKTSHYIAIHKLNELFLAKLKADFDSNFFGAVILPQQEKQTAESTNLLTVELKKIEEKLARVKEAYQAGIDTLEEYKENKRALQAMAEQLEEQLHMVQQVAAPMTQEEAFRKLRSAIKSSIVVLESGVDVEMQNNLIRTFVHHVVFSRPSCTVQIVYRL